MLDFLIVGQGIAGSILALQLLKRGKSIVVINNNQAHTASKVATGIYNRGVFVLPVGANKATIGATYDWHDLSCTPTEKARNTLEEKLTNLLKLPYEVVDHKAGIRPATLDRRPFIGLHPQYPHVGIFNGLGTKGVSLAPYLSEVFVNYLLSHGALPAAVQLNSVKRALYKTKLKRS